MLQDWQIAASVGLALVLVGAAMLRGHISAWDRQKNDPDLDDFDRQHYHARYRRRMQTSGLLIVLGVMIPAGDMLLPFLLGLINKQVAAIVSTLYWIGILLLTLWLILLAFGDLIATRAHGKIALRRVRRRQHELQEKLAQFKKHGSNGHSSKE